MFKKIFAILFMFVLYSQPTFALYLSFDDCISMVEKESQDLKKAQLNLEKAENMLKVARSSRFPKIEATTGFFHNFNLTDGNDTRTIKPLNPLNPRDPMYLLPTLFDQPAGNKIDIPDNFVSAEVSVTQPIYTFGKIGNMVDSVKQAIIASKIGKSFAKAEVDFAAANLYWTAKMLDDVVEVSRKSLNYAKSSRDKLKKAGRAARINLVKIESDIATKEIKLSDAIFNRDSAYRMLKILINIPMEETVVLTTDFPKTFDKLGDYDIKNNPEIKMLSHQIQMKQHSAAAKKANDYPSLVAMAAYNYYSMSPDISKLDKQSKQVGKVGLALKVPLFSGGLNSAHSMIETIEADSLRQELDKKEKMKKEEFNTAISNYSHLQENLKTVKDAKHLAEKAYLFSQSRFEAGQTSAVELSQVSESLYNLELALLNYKFKILMTKEQIKKLSGENSNDEK